MVIDSIADLNPDVKVVDYNHKLTEENALKLIGEYDVVADCSDNPTTRYLVHDSCFASQVPLVSASVIGFAAQLAVFKGYLFTSFLPLFLLPMRHSHLVSAINKLHSRIHLS